MKVVVHSKISTNGPQIALAYVYRIQEKFPKVLVFWVHASNTERFYQAFSQIAQICHIPGYEDPKANILELVKMWLQRKNQQPWFMIIDNADDTDVFFSSAETAPQNLADPNQHSFKGTLGRYIPECSHGAILVTTRNKQTGVKITKGRGMIEIEPMDQVDSRQLMNERLQNQNLDQNDVSLLTDRLENLPLAIIQAASFIQENSSSVARYLELLDQSDSHEVELLSQPFEAEGRDSSIPNAVAATWIISFKQIREQYPIASELLALSSFFDRQGIPLAFLSHYLKQNFDRKKHLQEEGVQPKTPLDLEQALGILKAFSFVAESEDHENLNMHRLIPLVMRRWLSNERKFGEWASKALMTVSDLYPHGEHETRKICGDYLPHVYAVLSYEGLFSTPETIAKANLLHHYASFMNYQGQLTKAEGFLLKAVEQY